MAIAISSDLVMDVVKAANPERAKLAQSNLRHQRATSASELQFTEAVDHARSKSGIGRFLTNDIVGDVVNAADPSKVRSSVGKLAGATTPKAKAYQQFEASVLRNFVEEMLPKLSETVYGAGTAGNVWRSMQADFMSQELAKSGGIGIASTLAKLDQAKSGTSLNQIPQQTLGAGHSIQNASEWPYFSRANIGVLGS